MVIVPSDVISCIDKYLLEIATFRHQLKWKHVIESTWTRIPNIRYYAECEGSDTEALEASEAGISIEQYSICLSKWASTMLQPMIDDKCIKIYALDYCNVYSIKIVKLTSEPWPAELKKFIVVEMLQDDDNHCH